MSEWKLRSIVYSVYQALLIVIALLVVTLNTRAWGEIVVSENLAVLVVLILSAVAVEARPVRWSAVQHTTLAPIVFLLTLMLSGNPVLVVAISGVGALVGHGLFREFPAGFHQMPGRAIQRTLFYTAQSIVAVTIMISLDSLLPRLMRTAFIVDAVVNFVLIFVYILLSKGFVFAYNRLMSFQWPTDTPLPTPVFEVFFIAVSAPYITMWFYRIVPEGSYLLVELLGQEEVRSLVVLFVWPLALLVFYVGFPYAALSLATQEKSKDSARFSRYSERMLDLAGVSELVARDMQAEFGCDDCVVYCWNGRESVYALAGGLLEGNRIVQASAGAMPDIGWPKVVAEESILGRDAKRDKLAFFQGKRAQHFLESVGFPCPQCTSVLVMPLQYADRESAVRIGFVVLTKRGGTFEYSDRVRANDYLSRRQTAAHTGLRQACRYRDAAQQLFSAIDEESSRAAEVRAATQALFAKGIVPAKLVAMIGPAVQNQAIIRVVRSIAQGCPPEETGEIFDEGGTGRLYTQMRQDDPNLPELTTEIQEHLTTVIASLSLPFEILRRWPWPPSAYGRSTSEIQDLYSLFESALEADTIEGILAFGTKLDDYGNLQRLAGDSPETVKELLCLQQVIHEVELSQDSRFDYETQANHLSAALQTLAPATDMRFKSPELVILAQIRDLWTTVIRNTREELMGHSELKMQLSDQPTILAGTGVIAELTVINRGRHSANKIAVRISPSDEYAIVDPADGRFRIVRLEPGQSHRLSFNLRPKREDFMRVAFKATWDDRMRTGQTISYAGRITLRPGAQIFVPIDNPYIPGRPLDPGSPVFVGREDVFDFIRNNIGVRGQHNVLVLTGQHRTGKTSLAQQLSQELDRDRYVVAFVDCQALGIERGVSLLLDDLNLEIREALEDYGIEYELPSLGASRHSITAEFEKEFLPSVLSIIGERLLVLIFDEFEALEARVEEEKLDASVFKYFRHLMQHSPGLAFIFVGSHHLRELTRDYWSIFSGLALYRPIGYLDQESARRLVTEPTERDIFDPYAVDEIIRLTAGHPYFLQVLCHYMVELCNRSHLPIITAQHVRDAVPDILVRAEAHLIYLWEAASPVEQMVMAAASHVLVGQDSLQTSDVAERLVACEVNQDPRHIQSSEEALVRREIFVRLSGDPPRYRFKVELVRRWIEREHPLSLVVWSSVSMRR